MFELTLKVSTASKTSSFRSIISQYNRGRNSIDPMRETAPAASATDTTKCVSCIWNEAVRSLKRSKKVVSVRRRGRRLRTPARPWPRENEAANRQTWLHGLRASVAEGAALYAGPPTRLTLAARKKRVPFEANKIANLTSIPPANTLQTNEKNGPQKVHDVFGAEPWAGFRPPFVHSKKRHLTRQRSHPSATLPDLI